jgi:hypothetical protein
MSNWKSEEIATERRKLAKVNLADASKGQLIDRIVALETSLYKIAYPLHELDIEPSPRASAWMTSKLFPYRYLDKAENEEFCVFDANTKQFVGAQVASETMHQIDYILGDSVQIDDGSKLSDDLEILSVYQSAVCASIYGGSIFMGDVREAARLLWSQPASPDSEAQNG